MTDYEKAVTLWQKRHVSTDAELAKALSWFSIAFSYHSGKIENENVTYNDTREIFEHDGVTSYTGDLRALFEIRNSKEANELLLTAFNEKRPVDKALVREFQQVLTQNTYDTRRWQLGERPGEFKRHDYVTGKNEIGASLEDVPEEMAELLAELDGVPDDKALTAAAYFHTKFENIHPFADGNGRTGRLVSTHGPSFSIPGKERRLKHCNLSSIPKKSAQTQAPRSGPKSKTEGKTYGETGAVTR